MFLRDLELAFKRVEANDLTGLIEFSLLMGVIKETHSQLSDLLVRTLYYL